VAAIVRHRTRQAAGWYLAPLLLLNAAALLANHGMDPTPRASGASTDSVVVTATVASSLDVQDQCTGAVAITVVMGGYADGTCAINFGASNDPSVNLRVSSSAGAFLSPANFADEGGACANLATADKVGLKVVSVGAGVTNQWGCALGAAGNNATTSHKGVPDAFTNVCLSSALGVTNTCTLGIGVFEFGSNATAGAYTGTVNLDVIG
jgi:hypothetical protein